MFRFYCFLFGILCSWGFSSSFGSLCMNVLKKGNHVHKALLQKLEPGHKIHIY